MSDEEKKVDDANDASDAPPGEIGEDGKYTDDGLAALVEKIKKGEAKVEDVDPPKDDKKDDQKDSDMIPRSRFNEVINERNQLREQLASVPKVEPKQQDEAPTVESLRADLAAKRKEWQKAIFDNDADKADALLSEMDQLEVTIDDARLAESESVTRAASADDVRYDNLLDQLQKDFPVIDKNSDQFDQKVVSEVYRMKEMYIAGGSSQTAALEAAKKYVLDPIKAQRTAEDRTTNSRKDTADALKRQPTNIADLGESGSAVSNEFGIDVSRLTPEQFDKIPEEVKSKLRGDQL